MSQYHNVLFILGKLFYFSLLYENHRYYKGLYTMKPCTVPDLDVYCSKLKTNLCQPGHMKSTRKQLFASKASCTARMPELADNHTSVLAIFGDKDPDFKQPDGSEEEANWIIEHVTSSNTTATQGLGLPTTAAANTSNSGSQVHPEQQRNSAGAATGTAAEASYYVMVKGAGHYPHVECPALVAREILQFIAV